MTTAAKRSFSQKSRETFARQAPPGHGSNAKPTCTMRLPSRRSGAELHRHHVSCGVMSHAQPVSAGIARKAARAKVMTTKRRTRA